MTRCISIVVSILAIVVCPSDSGQAYGQDPKLQPSATNQKNAYENTKTDSILAEKFKKGLTNTKFVGQFTISGAEDQQPREEEYTITTVEKLSQGDWWEIKARIKYGTHDVTVPMRMEVKWAGKTPVITVDRLMIPGLGTFDARVLLRKDKYAGTWAHDDVGGHLFGKIVKLEQSDSNNPDSNQKKKKTNPDS